MDGGGKNIVGLFGGSYNPVHIGHMMLASYLVQWGYVDKIWLNLSPQNPLKNPKDLIPDLKRLDMLNLALKGAQNIDLCDLELTMPTPSYTINTLDLLTSRFPRNRFKLVIGSDNWQIFEKWKDYQRILDDYGVIVYPRRGYPIESKFVDGMEFVDAPIVDISSTFIRKSIARGYSMQYFLPAGVEDYILKHKLYQESKDDK